MLHYFKPLKEKTEGDSFTDVMGKILALNCNTLTVEDCFLKYSIGPINFLFCLA